MFYSHEILTSREGGLATVWLIATVGSKSTAKKLSRKSILDVNVPKTCDKIINPEAPMALRLQSNLLYGVSRIFSQQSGYLLSDAQLAQTNMRTLLKAVRTSELDPNAGRARSEQLVVQDDPGFLPDFPLDMDLGALDISSEESSRHSSLTSRQSLVSSRSSQHSLTGLIPDLQIPSSAGGSIVDVGGFRTASDHGNSALRERLQRDIDEDGEGFDLDPGFSFDENGQLRNEPKGEEQAIAQVTAQPRGSEDNADEQVMRELAQAAANGSAGFVDFEPVLYDDAPLLPDAERFSQLEAREGDLHTGENEPSSETVIALLRGRPRRIRAQTTEQNTMLKSRDVVAWRDDYLKNMDDIRQTRHNRQAVSKAHKSALQSIFGIGIGNAGIGIGSTKQANPLQMFAGDNLMHLLVGTAPMIGRKRDRIDVSDDEPDSETKRQRMRDEEPEMGLGDQMGYDDDMPVHMSDQDVEIGRHAPTPLPDDLSYPWNMTASAIASRSHAGSSFAGRSLPAGFLSSAGPASSMKLPDVRPLDRRASRIGSSSPLGGRGAQAPSDEAGDIIMSDGLDAGIDDVPGMNDSTFKIRGPTATVGTQTQGQSQWTQTTLDREADNFLEYLNLEIGKLPTDVERDEDEEDELATTPEKLRKGKMITFEGLLPPQTNTSIVAAQALLHVLSLATKDLVNVRQDEAFGDIAISIVEGI